MTKSVSIYVFKDDNKFILHPDAKVKDWASIASPPYLILYDLSSEEVLEKMLYLLDLSKEGTRPPDLKESQKEYLKSMGFKTMKALHTNSISLGVFLKEGVLNFCPSINKGSRQGFYGVPLDQRVLVPLNSSKNELIKALELALERCQ